MSTQEENILKYLSGEFLTEIYKHSENIKSYWIYNNKLNITLYNHLPFSNIQENFENLIKKCKEWLKEKKYNINIVFMEENLVTCKISYIDNPENLLYETQETNQNLSILKTCFDLFEKDNKLN